MPDAKSPLEKYLIEMAVVMMSGNEEMTYNIYIAPCSDLKASDALFKVGINIVPGCMIKDAQR